MCGRFTLRTPASTLAGLFDALRFPAFEPRYNICPTQPVACIRYSASGDSELANLRWGLIPFWAKDQKIGARMINARSETVSNKPAFRAAFKSRRCLILGDGFYEWKKIGKAKQPYYISRTDDQPFAMAGLWESWQDKSDPDKPIVESCTILTTEANALMEPLHDRMPVIVSRDDYEFWLDSQFDDRPKLQRMFRPCEPNELRVFLVDRMVNKVGNDSPQCIQPIRQQDLF
ncbi:MAG: SOS response-associated peptidase [Planctomycetota bacterium]